MCFIALISLTVFFSKRARTAVCKDKILLGMGGFFCAFAFSAANVLRLESPIWWCSCWKLRFSFFLSRVADGVILFFCVFFWTTLCFSTLLCTFLHSFYFNCFSKLEKKKRVVFAVSTVETFWEGIIVAKILLKKTRFHKMLIKKQRNVVV